MQTHKKHFIMLTATITLISVSAITAVLGSQASVSAAASPKSSVLSHTVIVKRKNVFTFITPSTAPATPTVGASGTTTPSATRTTAPATPTVGASGTTTPSATRTTAPATPTVGASGTTTPSATRTTTPATPTVGASGTTTPSATRTTAPATPTVGASGTMTPTATRTTAPATPTVGASGTTTPSATRTTAPATPTVGASGTTTPSDTDACDATTTSCNAGISASLTGSLSVGVGDGTATPPSTLDSSGTQTISFSFPTTVVDMRGNGGWTLSATSSGLTVPAVSGPASDPFVITGVTASCTTAASCTGASNVSPGIGTIPSSSTIDYATVPAGGPGDYGTTTIVTNGTVTLGADTLGGSVNGTITVTAAPAV